jgi:hypothetical protein
MGGSTIAYLQIEIKAKKKGKGRRRGVEGGGD